MKGTHLGELEELVLLTAAVLDGNAYTVTIANEIKDQSGRTITISSVHTSLHRLEEKGFVKSEVGGSSKTRGGRRKRLYVITQTGYAALEEVKNLRSKMWDMIPKPKFS